MPLREEHEEGQHEGEQANSLSQGEAQNGVVEEHLGEVGLASAGNEQVAEDRADSEADASEGDGGEASADVVETLDRDGHGGCSGLGSYEGSRGHEAASHGLGDNTAHHLVEEVNLLGVGSGKEKSRSKRF